MRQLSRLAIVFFVLAGLLATGGPARTEELTAQAIMARVDARDDGDRSTADMTMLLIDKHGQQRRRTIRSLSMDQGADTLSLMFFLAPGDVKGTGFLTHDYAAAARDDEQWLYLPALKKSKRIAASDKSGSFMGSDFTYADLTKKRLDDYTYSFNPEQRQATVYERPCWVIDSLPRGQRVIEETGYLRSTLFVRQDNFMVVRAIHFVDQAGERKYFDVKKMACIDTIWTGVEIHMTRKRGGNTIHQTILTLDNVRYHQEAVHEGLFTVRTLERGL